MALTVLQGDVLDKLRELPDESVHCCVTSPPYWGLRDYGTAQWEGGESDCQHLFKREDNRLMLGSDGKLGKNCTSWTHRDATPPRECKCGAKRIDSQLGLEKTPEEYVAKMVEIFREVRRVLRKDGTLWLNLGDSYAGSWGNYGGQNRGNGSQREITTGSLAHQKSYDGLEHWKPPTATPPGLKPKDLCGIPWRVAFALQADGWYLRQDIIWAKPNPMPESVTDRCTKAHEYLFLLTKSARYFYDAEAIKEKATPQDRTGIVGYAVPKHEALRAERNRLFNSGASTLNAASGDSRNKRSVWTVATAPYPEAHFATYPPDLIKPCILAGTSAKGCCVKCGAPWERMLAERNPPSVEPSQLDRFGNGDAGVHRKVGGQYQKWLDENPTKTLGWQPTCKHFNPSMGGGGTSFRGHKGHLKADGSPIVTPKVTTGWSEACDCNSGVIPCTILDPFAGSGTTGAVALELGRKAILIELNPKYVQLINQRCNVTMGLQLA